MPRSQMPPCVYETDRGPTAAEQSVRELDRWLTDATLAGCIGDNTLDLDTEPKLDPDGFYSFQWMFCSQSKEAVLEQLEAVVRAMKESQRS